MESVFIPQEKDVFRMKNYMKSIVEQSCYSYLYSFLLETYSPKYAMNLLNWAIKNQLDQLTTAPQGA